MGVAEGKRWPGTEAETKFAEYLVRTAGAHFVIVVRRGVGKLLGVRVPGQTFVVKELVEATSDSTLESLQRENEGLRLKVTGLKIAVTQRDAYLARAEAAEAEMKRLRDELDSAACLLETLSEDKPADDVDAIMMRVMAERNRAALSNTGDTHGN